MEAFVKDIIKDYHEENYTLREWVKYGIVYPIGFILIVGFAGWLDSIM